MGKAALFLWHFLAAKFRLFWFELHPASYRKFHLALALPRWRQFAFYQPLEGGFETFPEMTKANLLAAFPLLNRFGASYERCLEIGLSQEESRNFLGGNLPYSVGLSSGTSGRRGVFLTTESERVRWAATILAHAKFLSLLRPQRIAFFLRANSPLYEGVGGGRIQFRFFDLARPLEELFPELQVFAPTVIIAPPALLTSLRRSELAGAHRVKPEVVVSVADKLEKDAKTDLEAHFGQRIHEIYQATEGFLGITCAQGTLHLNEDLLFFEPLWTDASHTAFEPLLSDYFRESQAIVRFRLGDVLVPGSCSCGSRRMAIREVRGRCDDTLRFRLRDGREVEIWPDFVRQAVQSRLERDLDFRVVQEPARLRIELSEEPSAQSLALASSDLRRFLEARGVEPLPIDWSFSLRRGPGEKRKRVERRS